MPRWIKKIGVDQAVVYALFTRAWGMLSSLVMLTLVLRFFSPSEQGFYYTFAAILAAQIVFELGMGVVVTQFASHSMAKLSWTSDGTLQGPAREMQRMRSLVRLTLRWYGVLGISICCLLGPVGWWFISRSAVDSDVNWKLPWALLIIAAATNLTIQPLISIFEGCQKIALVAKMRFAQGLIGSVFGWITIIVGGGLFALSAWNIGVIIVTATFLVFICKPFLKQMLMAPKTNDAEISWRNEIWPFQWRIALSWISGYFIFQLFVPALFSTHGPVEAGRMGLSLAIASALMGISVAWLNTKVPIFGNLIARGDYESLDRLWKKTATATVVLLCIGSAVLFAISLVIQGWQTELSRRLLPATPLALLLLATVCNFITIAQAAYLRAHKEEPFLILSITNGIAVAVCTGLLASSYGATGIMAGYFFCSLGIGLLWGTLIFIAKRKGYRLLSESTKFEL